MAVTFDSHVAGAWNPDTGTMRFFADQNGTPILCAISREALEDRSRTSGLNVPALLSVFERYRGEIEQKAAAKIQAGELEANGTILVRTSDLTQGKSAPEAPSVPDAPPPRPPQQPPTGWMEPDDTTIKIIQQPEARRRAYIAATAGVIGPPLPPAPAPPEAPPEDELPKIVQGEARMNGAGQLTADATIDAIPEQTRAASQFALDASGRIDLILDPPYLGDPEQRVLYAELRRKAFELSGLSHNELGDLAEPANQFLAAMLERADEASIVLVWSRGNTLRVLIAAHDEASASTDPTHPARLSVLAAAKLRDLVETFNAFIDRDLEGRELDQRRRGPDAREEDALAVEAAEPLLEVVRDSGIATAAAVDALTEQLAAASAPGTNNDRATGLMRRTFGNFTSTALRIALGVAGVAASGIVGDEAVGVVAGSPHPIVAFLINHAPEMRAFIDHVMHNPALIRVLDAIVQAGAATTM
jgi:Protein of unknown function (DUF1488)